jgi:uncharacterized membrane protein YfcA
LVAFAAYATQTMSGFGGIIIGVTFGAHLYSIPEVLTLMVPLSLGQLGYVAIRHRVDIDWSLLTRRILPLMGVGLVAGIWLADRMTGPVLRTAFGLLVVVLSARELYALGTRREHPPRDPRSLRFRSLLVSSGLVHGVYATGGPILVYAVSRQGMGKGVFRSTLTAVWLTLNVVLTGRYALEGRFDAEVGWKLLVLFPAVPLGIWCGEALHARVSERTFKIVVFTLLSAAGLGLVVS